MYMCNVHECASFDEIYTFTVIVKTSMHTMLQMGKDFIKCCNLFIIVLYKVYFVHCTCMYCYVYSGPSILRLCPRDHEIVVLYCRRS